MKRTRKSLFISTILMVVLLIVAISTATFAWYSSQNQAKAENAKLTTASTTAANIGIYFEGDGAAGSAVSKVIFGAVTSLKPLVPTTDPAEIDPANLAFNEGIVTMNLNNQRVFKEDAAIETPWKQIEAVTGNTKLYIENLDPDASRKVAIETKINVGEADFEDGAPGLNADEETQTTILNEAKEALRVAIYVKEGSTDAQYLGTYAQTTAKYGIPEEGEPIADFGAKINSTNDGTFTKFDAVGGGSRIQVFIFAWLEGPIIEARHALVSVPFSLTFEADGNSEPVSPEPVSGD